jgi:hypothetical protein
MTDALIHDQRLLTGGTANTEMRMGFKLKQPPRSLCELPPVGAVSILGAARRMLTW